MAASSSSRGRAAKKPTSSQTANGIVLDASARISPRYVLISPKVLKMIRRGTKRTIGGIK
jgi:hypothetical protein